MTHLPPYGIGERTYYDPAGQIEQIDQLLEREKPFLGAINTIDIYYKDGSPLANIAMERAKRICNDVHLVEKASGEHAFGLILPSSENTYYYDHGGDVATWVARGNLNLHEIGIAGLFFKSVLPEIAFSDGKWHAASLSVAPEIALITENLWLVDKGKHVYALDAAEKILRRYPDCWRGLHRANSEWSENEKIQAVSKFLVLRARDLEEYAKTIGKPLDPCSSFDAGYEKNYGERVPSQSTTIKLRTITGKQFNAYHVEQKIDTHSVDAVWDCAHDKEAAQIYERLKKIGLPVFYRGNSKLIVGNVNDGTVAAKITKAFELQSAKSKTRSVKR